MIQARHLDLAPATEKTSAAYEANGTLGDVARKHAVETLEKNGENISKSARELGISRTTLKKRLREWGVKVAGDT